MQLLNRSRKPGFTLPELLVATALSLVIMAIIAVAFQKGIDAFRALRAVASMQDKLKSAENVIKRDLASEHFSGIFKPGFGGPFLRDQRLDLIGWYPPDEGYFTITQGPIPNPPWEGLDSDGLPSFMATNDSLQFTVKLSGKRDEDYVRAIAPPPLMALAGVNAPDFTSNPLTQLVTRWAEVGYFVVANGQYANGQPLYTLYRRQRAALSTETLATINASYTSPQPSTASVAIPSGYNNPALTANYCPDISMSPSITNATQVIVNCSSDLTRSSARMTLTPITGTYQGDDILLTNVISFEVKVNWSTGSATPTTLQFPGPAAANDWPFPSPVNSSGQAIPMTFDTGSRTTNLNINWDDPTSFPNATGIPSRIRVNAIQIRIRIWDSASQTARQLTIVQDV